MLLSQVLLIKGAILKIVFEGKLKYMLLDYQAANQVNPTIYSIFLHPFTEKFW